MSSSEYSELDRHEGRFEIRSNPAPASDLKLLDELLCSFKHPRKGWEEIEKSGYHAEKQAIKRLREAWGSGEMKEITLSLGNYFDAEVHNGTVERSAD